MNITIRKARKEDLPGIAAVHIECFPDYFSTKMGKKILSSYYGKYLETDPDLFFIAYDNEQNKVIGLTNGYVSGDGRSSREEFISANKWGLIFRILLMLVKCDKVVWKKVIEILKSKKKTVKTENNQQQNKPKKKKIGLLSICVKKEYRGTQAASMMIEKFDKACMEQGVGQYALSVFPDNSRAVAFYKKMGFEFSKETENHAVYTKKLVK